MKVTFYGARGSYPIADKEKMQYGGHTTCFHIKCKDGTHVILDAGTGIRNLGKKLMEEEFGRGEGTAHIFFTHTHWDHILGLPFFEPLFVKGNTIHLYTAKLPYSNIQAIFNGLFKPDIFPVPFEDLNCEITLNELPKQSETKAGNVLIKNMQINHNNITLGYRVEFEGHSFTLISDNAIIEYARMGNGFNKKYAADPMGFIDQYRRAQKAFAENSDILVVDTHFTKETIKGREHWGHSTPDEAIKLALDYNPSYLILHHHDPENPDTEVSKKENYVIEALKDTKIKVLANKENLTINLGAD